MTRLVRFNIYNLTHGARDISNGTNSGGTGNVGDSSTKHFLMYIKSVGSGKEEKKKNCEIPQPSIYQILSFDISDFLSEKKIVTSAFFFFGLTGCKCVAHKNMILILLEFDIYLFSRW